MSKRRLSLCLLVAVLAAMLWPSRDVVLAQQPVQEQPISPQALAQMEALAQEKASRTPAERKISSQLLYAMKMLRGEQVAPGVQLRMPRITQAPDGRIDVDVTARAGTDLRGLLATRNARVLGLNVSTRGAGGSVARAHIDADSIMALAARADVTSIRQHEKFMLSGTTRLVPKFRLRAGQGASASALGPRTSGRIADDVNGRTQRLESLLRDTLARRDDGGGRSSRIRQDATTDAVPSGQGSRASEGDVTHQANIAREMFGVDGTGVKIGVLSDGVEHLADSQAAGDLGPVTVLPGQVGTGDEGTAMLEIIHDLAPGAQLYFASGFSSISQFALNIRDLRTAGCDIIVDDLAYYVESPFQDGQTSPSSTNGGIVTQAVNDVTAAGALYFSSAGNEGNQNDGTSGVWEGDFLNGGAPAPPLTGAGTLHDFGGGQTWDTVSAAGSQGVTLYWSDPLGASANDYDFYIMNAAGTAILDASTDLQDGDDDPYESTDPTFNGERLIVAQFAGSGRYLHLNVNRGELAIGTAGQTHGHNAAANAYAVAATPAAESFSGPNPGPYPNAFTAANAVETFSSDGPRRLFYQPDGTPFTPGNVSSTGGIVRQKPDITAADGVKVTGVGGFGSPFYGTSASAPHAGAIAALIKQASPSATPAQIRTWLTSSALDIETAGVDRDAGAGIIMPIPALLAAGATGTPFFDASTVTVEENPGNGDGMVYGGEGGKLTVALTNVGVIGATAISATLSSTTPGVTVTSPATRAYADLAASATASNAVPFTFTLPSDAECGLVVSFTLTVTFSGGSSQVLTLPVTTGILDLTTIFDATPAPASPLYTAAAGTQTDRVSRNAVVSTCAAPKPFPGVVAAAGIGFESYAFTTCPASPGSCAQVSLKGPVGLGPQLFSTTYDGSFDPADVQANYMADLGQTYTNGLAESYGVSLPAGAQTFVVAISEITAGAASGQTYGLQVSGACLASCTRNHVPVAVVHNVVVAAGPGGTAVASIDNGSNDADSDPLTITASPAGPYAVGATNVLLTVTDDKGATSQATATVTVLPEVTVTSLTPATGPAIGGTVVSITGTGFSTAPGGTAVTFGGVAATNVTCASAGSCQATSPAGTGIASVRVTVSGFTSADTPADDFTYVPAPAITSLSPASGAVSGGTIVTITGTGFSATPGATTVMFGAAAGTNISCASVTACVVTSPAGTGTISVRATVGGQTSADTAADDFAYSTQVYLLADGATGTFFDEDVVIANANMAAAPVTLKFFTESGTTITDTRTIAAQSRATVHVDAIPGLEATSVAAEITSESGLPLAVERSMFWDSTYYAGHAGPALAAPATQWYFAEGAQGFFDTFVLVNNPNASPAVVTFTFLREHETPIVKTVTVAGTSRYTLPASGIAELRTRSFAITVTATQPVTADRAMYFGSTASRLWGGGTASAGSALSPQWYFAEGATGSFFDTFFLLGNPQDTDAQVTLTYLLDSGETVTVQKVVPAHERLTLNPETDGDARLKSAAFATTITSDVAIVAERSMYWAGKALPWGEAHNSTGQPAPALTWDLAEGRAGGEHRFHTYILVANPQATAAELTVTYLRETGTPVLKTYVVPATGRLTIDANEVPELADSSFGARVAVTNNMPVIVERSMYWNANGVFWSGGSSGTGIRVP